MLCAINFCICDLTITFSDKWTSSSFLLERKKMNQWGEIIFFQHRDPPVLTAIISKVEVLFPERYTLRLNQIASGLSMQTLMVSGVKGRIARSYNP